MRKIIMKHTCTHARDCAIEWIADFAKMTFTIKADFISPYLLLEFLSSIQHRDERFSKTGIVGAVQICEQFDVRLRMSFGTTFKMRAYLPFQFGAKPALPEIELFVMAESI